MGIEARPELLDLLLGRGASERPGAPEPTLLPLVAPFAGRDALRSLCVSIEIYAGGRSGPPPWPDLRNAVFLGVAPRIGADASAEDLLGESPALASFLPGERWAAWALSLEPGGHASGRAQLLVRFAARYPQYGDGRLLTAARAALAECAAWERDRLLGWLGAAESPARRQDVLGAMLASKRLDPETVAAFLPHLQAPQQERLALHLAESLGTVNGVHPCQLLHLLPWLEPRARARLLEVIRPELLQSGNWLPGWYSSLIVARLSRWGEAALALEFVESLEDLSPAWRSHLLGIAETAFGDQPYGDVLGAHPGAAAVLQEGLSLESLSPAIPKLLDRMIDYWGGTDAPPSPPPRTRSEEERPRRGAGVFARVARMGRRIGQAVRSIPRSAPPPPPEDLPDEPERSGAEPPEPAASPRYLQADVLLKRDGGLIRRRKSFERGGLHEIRVSIAPEDAALIRLDTEFPDDRLPPEQAKHELTVLLVAAGLLDSPLSRAIDLPRTGPSTVATFEVAVPGDREAVQMMIIVLHRGTHIQTGYLDGPATAGEASRKATGFNFRAAQRSAADLDHGQKPDLTIYKDGDDLVIHRPGHGDELVSMTGIGTSVELIRTALFKGASGAYQLESGLSSGPGLKLLRLLAAQGELMRRTLFEGDALNDVRRVQVVSPASADFFPVEYFYDRRPPKKDAALCPAFAAATGSDGDCAGCAAADDGSIVCPAAFWGLNRVIERQVRPRGLSSGPPSPSPEPQTDGDLLPAVSGVVLAASDHVNDENPEEVKETLAALNQITGTRSYLAADWSEWRDLTAQHQPVLLVALPHNVDNEMGMQALQIGAKHELAFNEIGLDYQPPPQSVILLLGCNTASAAVGYQDFIASLRGAGAAVVVGTITYVLGMQAAPLAREFVRAFWSHPAGESVPMGELVRAVRTRMVRDGNPLALAIAAYGGADWRLIPREE